MVLKNNPTYYNSCEIFFNTLKTLQKAKLSVKIGRKAMGLMQAAKLLSNHNFIVNFEKTVFELYFRNFMCLE